MHFLRPVLITLLLSLIQIYLGSANVVAPHDSWTLHKLSEKAAKDTIDVKKGSTDRSSFYDDVSKALDDIYAKYSTDQTGSFLLDTKKTDAVEKESKPVKNVEPLPPKYEPKETPLKAKDSFIKRALTKTGLNKLFASKVKTTSQSLSYMDSIIQHAFETVESNLHKEGIFRIAGSDRLMTMIALNQEPLTSMKVYEAADMIRRQLKLSMEGSRIPLNLQKMGAMASSDSDLERDLKLYFETNAKDSRIQFLKRVMELARKVSANAEKNKMTASSIAMVLAGKLVPENVPVTKIQAFSHQLARTLKMIIEKDVFVEKS